jgi:hypothetical protein
LTGIISRLIEQFVDLMLKTFKSAFAWLRLKPPHVSSIGQFIHFVFVPLNSGFDLSHNIWFSHDILNSDCKTSC